tara:strand:- start:6020 stop:8806 length:2787 start_codon:yes stop_codon:yes gene_type:complete
MARINIPAPISTYKDLGTVELAKLARNQYIEGYGAANEFRNSVSNMQSLEQDDHIKNRLSDQYTNMLDTYADRGDYETLGLAINKSANQFVRDYKPVETSFNNRVTYQEKLQKAYEKGDINANTFNGMLQMSDYGYSGIQYGEDGSLDENSIYSGTNFYNDVDITEKINDRLKEVKPFIRQNLGTDIPYNENMEITTANGLRGEPKFWVTTKSKTVQIPDNIIQMVVNDVMQDPDVQASMAQQIQLDTYMLGEINPETQQPVAMDYINKLIASEDIKAEEIGPLLEQVGPLQALQNIMFQDAMSRETQMAIGTFGGVRQSSSGRKVRYDQVWKTNNDNKLKKANEISDDDLAYDVTMNIKPFSNSYDDVLNKRNNSVNLLKTNLGIVTGHLNQDPDKIEYDNQGNEIFGSGGLGLELEDMNTSGVINAAESQIDAWRSATAQMNTPKLDYTGWRSLGNHSTQKKDESVDTYLARLDSEYAAYASDVETKRQIGYKYLSDVSAANDLDFDKYNSTMYQLSTYLTDYDVYETKINNPVKNLNVPNSNYGNNLTYPEYVEGRGKQLNAASFDSPSYSSNIKLSGADWVAAYNKMLADNPEIQQNNPQLKPVEYVTELPSDLFKGGIFESFAFAGNQNSNLQDYSNYLANHINTKYNLQGTAGQVGGIVMADGLGSMAWAGETFEQYRHDNQFAFQQQFEGWHSDLNDELSNLENKFNAEYSSASIPISAAVITNFGAQYETASIVNKQIKDFFKDETMPSNWSVRDASGQSDLKFESGFINSSKDNESNHFGYNVQYKIIENQTGVLNTALGDEGPMIYVPIKITNSPSASDGNVTDHKGKVFNMLVPAHYFNMPALQEYVNGPEMEINTLWNHGVFNRVSTWSPQQFSNVTFIYDRSGSGKDQVKIGEEYHDKGKGLSILVQNLINKRGK